MYLNPFSENFFGYKIINGIIDGFKSFFIGNDEDGSIGILGHLGNLADFFANFFTNLSDFIIHIFIPSAEQWERIKQDYSDLGEIIKNKLPFVSVWQQSLENAQNQVFASNDFLNIKMPSFSFYGGQTKEQQVVNVRDAYEPYRLQIRSLLALIVYGCGFVYCVKTVLNYNATASGLDHAEIQSHLKGNGDN